MKRKRHSVEQIIGKLLEAEVLLSHERMGMACEMRALARFVGAMGHRVG